MHWSLRHAIFHMLNFPAPAPPPRPSRASAPLRGAGSAGLRPVQCKKRRGGACLVRASSSSGGGLERRAIKKLEAWFACQANIQSFAGTGGNPRATDFTSC